MMDMMGMSGGGSMGGGMNMGGMNMSGGMNMGGTMAGPMGQGGYQMGYGYMPHMQTANTGFLGLDFGSFINGLFSFTFNILALLLVVGLIVGIVVFLKRALVDGNTGLSDAFGKAFTPAKASNCRCAQCESVISSNFKFCPVCGASTQPTKTVEA